MKHIVKFTLIGFLSIGSTVMQSCKEKPTIPVLTTDNVSEITQTTAVSGGNVTNDGGAEVNARGICWATKKSPTIGSEKTSDGTGSGIFTSKITGLNANSVYYVRAYATNSEGTNYGNEITFTTSPVSVPSITTAPVISVTFTTAVSGGTVSDNGGNAVTSIGVCWSTSQNPTTADSKMTSVSAEGSYTSGMTGLTPGTTYYVRAFATNSAGTGYGNQQSFKTNNPVAAIAFNSALTYSQLSDIEGNTYKTIQIGTQTWMAENLKTAKYNDGTAIPNVTDANQWITLSNAAYCIYSNDVYYRDFYGALYNWYAVNTGNLCPTGWHVPTRDECTVLTDYLGGGETAAAKLMEAGTSHWVSPNTAANNQSGFTSLPGGSRSEEDGNFIEIGVFGGFWTSSQSTSAYAYVVYLTQTRVGGPAYSKKMGSGVRCVKN